MILLSLISVVLSRHRGYSSVPLMCVASVKLACTPAFASVIRRAVLVASAEERSWREINMQWIRQNFCLYTTSALLPFISPKVVQLCLLPPWSLAFCSANTHSNTLSDLFPRLPVAEGSSNPSAPLPQSCNPGPDYSNLAAYWHLVQADCSRTPTQHSKRGVAGIKEIGRGGFKVQITDCHLLIPTDESATLRTCIEKKRKEKDQINMGIQAQ